MIQFNKMIILLLFCVIVFNACATGTKEKLTGDYLGQQPPGDTPELFAPGIISHGFHEHNIAISPTGDEMFYVTSSGDHERYFMIYLKKVNDVWSKPEIASFSGEFMDMGPSFSPDGNTLYFCSKRPLEKGGEEINKFDIWVTEKLNGEWGEPNNIGKPVNSENNEIFATVSVNGTIYFQYYEVSGGKSDFYFSELVEGNYQIPQRLEYGISTEHYESGLFVSHDEKILMFQSNRPGSIKGVDLYVSFRDDKNNWCLPINLGDEINSLGNLINPMLSPDGKYFFFSSNKHLMPFSYKGKSYAELLKSLKGPENGYGAIYWVDAKIVTELKPY